MINPIGKQFYTKHPAFNSRQMQFESGSTIDIPQNSADKFLREIEIINKKRREGNFFNKYCWSTTATLTGGAIPLVYELVNVYKAQRLKTSGNIPQLKKYKKAHLKNLAIWSGVGVVVMQGIQYILKSQENKNLKKLNEKFTQINKTNAKLSDDKFSSMYTGAYYDIMTGDIHINRDILNDPIYNNTMIKLIKHELIHAKQFEMIVRSKDGIKKLNYGVLMSVINSNNMDDIAAGEFKQILYDIKNDKIGKYDNITFKLGSSNADVNFKDYIIAVNTLLDNPKATYNDIPIIIDKNHYEKIIKNNPPLTLEEEEKATKYYNALIEYKTPTAWSAYNPFSFYWTNLLEKEAYKENQSWLMGLFNR